MTNNEWTGIETQLFTWDGWDEISTADLHFYDCTLKVDIGPFKAGSTINGIALMFSTSTIEFYDGDGNVSYSAKLVLSVT